MVNWRPTFGRTKPNIFIAMHKVLAYGSPWIRSVDVRGCKSNDRSNARHSFWRFVRESNTSFQDLAGTKRALARSKTMYEHAAYFLSRTPACIVIIIKVKIFRMAEAVFEKEWTYMRHFSISCEFISAGNSRWIATFWISKEFDWPFARRLKRGQTIA